MGLALDWAALLIGMSMFGVRRLLRLRDCREGDVSIMAYLFICVTHPRLHP